MDKKEMIEGLEAIRDEFDIKTPYRKFVVQEAINTLKAQTESGATVPLDRLVMPRALTAENGAKGLLMGEFSEEIELSCPDCDGGNYHDLPTDQCGTCNDTGLITPKVDISWTTIKSIYAMAVKHLGA